MINYTMIFNDRNVLRRGKERLMDIEKIEIEGKELTLYKAARGTDALCEGMQNDDMLSESAECDKTENAGGTLVVLNAFEDEGKGAVDELTKMGRMDFDLLCVGGIEWNRDLSPWSCEPIMPGEEPFAGGADEYLRTLTDSILPEAVRRIGGVPAHVGIAGYSLAGLFALYANYSNCCAAVFVSLKELFEIKVHNIVAVAHQNIFLI